MPCCPDAVDGVHDVSYADSLLVDSAGVITCAHGRTARRARADERELVGLPLLDLVALSDRQRGRDLLGAARAGDALVIDTLRMTDGRTAEFALQARGDGLVLAETWDVTVRDIREQDLRERSLHDPLTGIANRLLVLDRLDWALTPRRSGPAPVGVLFVDIDGFKRINDRWGHGVGDAVLVEAAQRIAAVLRSADTVGRMGGDEFVAVCGELDSPDDLRRVGERVSAALQVPATLNGVEVPLGASTGGAVCLDGSADAAAMLRAADAAMYDAKSAGGRQLKVRMLAQRVELNLP